MKTGRFGIGLAALALAAAVILGTGSVERGGGHGHGGHPHPAMRIECYNHLGELTYDGHDLSALDDARCAR